MRYGRPLEAIALLAVGFAGGYLAHQLREALSPRPVEVARATLKSWNPSLTLRGVVVPRASARVSTAQAGKLETVYFREGNAVEKGQALARLEQTAAKQELAEAQAALSRAQAELERKVARGKPEEVEPARAELLYRQTRLTRTEENLKNTTILAPFSGMVSRLLAQPGDWLNKGGKIMEIVDITRAWIKVEPHEKQLPFLKKGTSAQVKVEAFPERSFEGVVSRLLPVAEKGGRFPAIVEVDNPGLLLKAGMAAAVHMVGASAREVLAVPSSAIRIQNEVRGVLVVNRGQARFKPVETGMETEGQIEVKSGLNPGDLVTVAGPDSLKTGDKVKIIKTR